MRAPDVPELVRSRALAAGEPGRRWLSGLVEDLTEIARDWDLAIGTAVSGGSASYVATATTADGVEAVLKIVMPGEPVEREIAVLRHAAGRGYVRLLRGDAERRALLMERLGPSLEAGGIPLREQLATICATLRTTWAVAPDRSLQTGAEKARWLAAFISTSWEERGRPCPERVVDLAVAFAASREAAFDPASAVLVHGDAHGFNTLRVPGTDEYRLIDPDGLFAEPACDLAVPMREYSRDLLAAPDALAAARDRCRLLARLAGVDPRAIWEWGFMERVSTGLLALTAGWEQVGTEMLTVAAAVGEPW